MIKSDSGTLQAIEAERAIVAALFAGSGAADAFDRLQMILSASDFFVAAHGAVFDAFTRLVDEGIKDPDPATLANKVKSLHPVTDELKGILSDALVYPFHAENIEEYGRAVVEKARARKIASGLTEIAGRAGMVGGELSSADLLHAAEAFVHDFGDGVQKDIQLLEGPNTALEETLTHLQLLSEGEITGVASGLTELDERLGRFQNGELIVVGARPSMGKTALGLGAALNHAADLEPVSLEKRDLVVIFSLEMPTKDLVKRALANLGRIDHDRLRKARLTDDDYSRLSVAIGRYSGLDIRIDTDPELTPTIMRAKLRLLQKRTGRKVGFVLVDYLSLMESDKQFANNKAAEVGEVSKRLKRIAKEFDCPVMALAQLNRKVEERADKRPMMSDLRESGSIEQDADTILFLYRDEYYNPDSPHKGMAEVIVAKARNGGQLGTVPAAFLGHYVRFENAPYSGSGY